MPADRDADALTIRPADRPGDLGWILERHGVLYAAEFGWDARFEALVARIVADFAERTDRQRETGFIAELDGRRAGCVLLVAGDEARTAKLRILLVDEPGRGRGVGRALVRACVDFAREAGYERVRLWTNHPLVAARRIYEAAGFRLVGEERHRDFGVELTGQVLELDLAPPSA